MTDHTRPSSSLDVFLQQPSNPLHLHCSKLKLYPVQDHLLLGLHLLLSISTSQLHDLQLLQASISKAKQHMEIIVRHHFLENVRSRYANLSSWRSVFHERKSTATKRSWPNVLNQSVESSKLAGSLFIEDGLVNLEIEQNHMQEMREESELAPLQKNGALFFNWLILASSYRG